jgi:hypothetical protein
MKKVAPISSVALNVTLVGAGMSGSKASAGGAKKAIGLVQQCHIPMACLLVETSLVESQESSPHHKLPKIASKPAHEASLQLTPVTDVSGASISHVVASISAG